MANYDKGEITDRERKAANNQTAISKQNIRDVQKQLKRQLSNYDFADRQNRALADTQLQQNSRKTSADRFEAQRDLQAATLGLLGSMGSAMNGSSTGNLMNMLRSRNDKENNTFWAQHQTNQDAVENSYNDSLNQNNVARRDAMQSAEKAISDITGDWRANMNNINPNLFPGAGTPVGKDKKLAASTAWDASKAKRNSSPISGYVIPDSRGNGGGRNMPTGQDLPSASMFTGGARNLVRGGDNQAVGGDYFSQMMNRFNGRPSGTDATRSVTPPTAPSATARTASNTARNAAQNISSTLNSPTAVANTVRNVAGTAAGDMASLLGGVGQAAKRSLLSGVGNAARSETGSTTKVPKGANTLASMYGTNSIANSAANNLASLLRKRG